MDDHKMKAIIFDLGNVMVDFDHTIAAQRISKFTQHSAQGIFDLFFDSDLTALFEEGKISSQDFFLKVKHMLNLKLDYDGFIPIWNDIFFLTEKNRSVYNLARQLKKNYKTALLSNINILHFDYLKKNFPIFDVFDVILTSFELGVRKPHPLIYKKTLDVLNVSVASEVFYTDDRAELVKTAKELGLKAFVFNNPNQLKQDLAKSGINLN